MSPRYLFDDPNLTALQNFPKYKGALRALCLSDDPWATRPAVELLCSGFTAIKPEIITVTPADAGASQDRPSRLLPPRTSRHAVARGGGMDPGGRVGLASVFCKAAVVNTVAVISRKRGIQYDAAFSAQSCTSIEASWIARFARDDA